MLVKHRDAAGCTLDCVLSCQTAAQLTSLQALDVFSAAVSSPLLADWCLKKIDTRDACISSVPEWAAPDVDLVFIACSLHVQFCTECFHFHWLAEFY